MLNSGTLLATRYRVTRKLGGGGMKMVYLVEDNRLANRPCALAEMIDSFTEPAEARAAAQAFAREADLLAQLKHDHIVQVLDRFSEHNRHYLVMEYLEGETLEERIKSSGAKLDEAAVLDITLQILAALEYLHTRTPAVIYRDLKPSNVILTPDGRVKVIDFGIARLFVPQKTATMIGTQGFAPPEQYKGKVEPRSDLYALGATMHYLLSGRDPATEIPFSFPPIQQLCRNCNPVLAEIINEALAYDLAQRIPSAADFKRRLQRLANPAAPAPRFAPSPAAPVNATGPGAPTVTGIVVTQQCPRCARDIPADAVVCPYCSAQLKPPVPSRRRRWPLVAAGLLVIAGVAFSGIYYYENVYVPQRQATAQAGANAAAGVAAKEQAAAKAAAEAKAARQERAQLMAQLHEQVRRLEASKPGSRAEQLAREDAIATALRIHPPPGVPADARALFDRGIADLKSATKTGDYRRAGSELNKALRMAPWYADGWMKLADADEGATAPGAAIAALRVYLLAAPSGADSAEVNERISELEQEVAQQQKQAEEQRKLSELKQQQEAEHAEQEAAARKAAEEQPGRVFRDCDECPEMVVVPAGSFLMGDDVDSTQHQVTIGRNFAVGKYPVTRHEYARFVAATGHINDEWKNPAFSQTSRDPVVDVNWNDAKAYVGWLSEKTGKSYRLLSQAEYEYAERAGTTTKYWWGDDKDEACSHACYDGKACDHTSTVPVGSYPANAFGLYDMAGNVWEWTEDCYPDNYAAAPNDGTAWTSGDCSSRVVRGGSWTTLDRYYLQSAARIWDLTGNRSNYYGFRVARTL